MDFKWSKIQKTHARELFELALSREYDELMNTINSTKVTTPDEVWDLHDMLGKKRKAMNSKYDYRYSQLMLVFAQLVRGNYLSLDELLPIGEEKQKKIEKMVHFKGF